MGSHRTSSAVKLVIRFVTFSSTLAIDEGMPMAICLWYVVCFVAVVASGVAFNYGSTGSAVLAFIFTVWASSSFFLCLWVALLPALDLVCFTRCRKLSMMIEGDGVFVSSWGFTVVYANDDYSTVVWLFCWCLIKYISYLLDIVSQRYTWYQCLPNVIMIYLLRYSCPRIPGADPGCVGWGSKQGRSHYAKFKVPRRGVRKMEIR